MGQPFLKGNMEVFTKVCLVAFGGASGALTRYGLNLLFAKFFAPFPFATFFINISGSFLIGFLITIFGEEYEVSENLRLALIVGFLGAYTTFSTFELETFSLIRDKQLTTAIIYATLSVAIGLISVLSGVWFGKKF